MKVSRKRSLPAAVAVAATLGLAATGVSCTGSKTETTPEKTDPSKATGPAVAKGDKTAAKPEPGKTATQPSGAAPGKTPPAPAPGPTAKTEPAKPAPGPAKTEPAKPAPAPPTPAKPEVAQGEPAKPEPPKTETPKTPPKEAAKPAPTAAKAPGEGPVAPPKPGAALPPLEQPKPGTEAAPTGTTPTQPPAKTADGAKPGEAPVARAESEADRILRQRVQELSLESEKRAILASTYVDQARDAAAKADWEACAEWASKALEQQSSNRDAEALLRQARSALGDRDAHVKSVADLMIESARVKRDQARFTAQTSLDAAMKAKAAGDYARALRHLETAETAILMDPAGTDWGELRSKVASEKVAVKEAKALADAAARREAAVEAYRAVKAEEAKVRLADAERRQALLKNAQEAFGNGDYRTASDLLSQYLVHEPKDENARTLLATSNRAIHNQASEDTLRLQRERFAQWRLDMQETTVPYHNILTWPSQEHWNTITEKRKELGTISEPVADSPETVATKNRLRTDRVDFSFEASPFKEVVNFIATAKGLNIVIANEVAPELEAATITLALNDVTVETALKTLNRIAGNLTYVVQGSVVYITKPELARAAPVIKVHAVGDLTVPLTNFIAGNLLLIPAGAEESEDQPRFGKAGEGVPSFGGVEELMDLIKKNVASEDYWGSEGVAMSASGTDKVLVVAEPNIQSDVAKFLSDLRAFAGLVVTIETRFLSVTDNFLRDVGVDIRGLGNGTPGRLAVLDDVTSGLDDMASAGFDNNGPGLPAAASSHPSSGAFFDDFSDGDYRGRTENVFDRALGRTISNIGGAIVQWTLVDDTDLSMILRAVEKTQEGRVLQAPSVTVYNTQRANITLITQLTYIQDFDVEVAQTAFIADPIIGIIQDGLVLDVQPTVSHDRKYITMTLRPTIANLVRPIPTFTTSLGAFTTPVTIQIPELKIQSAATTVRVPDQGTLVMGGLKSINLADLKSETPWFSSVPFAAFFFGRKASVKEMDNLMVIVKATISDLQEQEAKFRR
jgi:type II secretory pathway component GspD/PulD (secretin)